MQSENTMTSSIEHSALSPNQTTERTISAKAASVRFIDVSKRFGDDVVAVDNVSLEVQAGELVTLLGPSGCGKTTTLRMIAGLEMASQGQILIGDQDVTRLPATDRDVSMVFQSYALFPHMNVLENVSYGLRVSGLPKKQFIERALHGLKLVGLADYAKRLPSELSGGQQQRVAVARALVLEPQVLLFDEPLSNLDAKLRRQVREEIRDLQTSLGLTVVYVTHDQEEALAVSDRIIVMQNAAIAQIGTPRELYDTPADIFVADFIGESNMVDVDITAIDQTAGTAYVTLGNMTLTLPSRGLQPGQAKLAVRPNRVQLAKANDNQDNPSALKGRIEKAIYVGNHMEYQVSTDFGNWFALSNDVDKPFEQNELVNVSFSSHGPVLLGDKS